MKMIRCYIPQPAAIYQDMTDRRSTLLHIHAAFEDETLNYQSTSAVEAPWAMNIRYDWEYALGNSAIKETTLYLVELRCFGCKLSAARIPKMKL